MLGLDGWNLTVQGVRGCPTRDLRQVQVWQQVSFREWSPCEDSRYLEQGEKEREMLDLIGSEGES